MLTILRRMYKEGHSDGAIGIRLGLKPMTVRSQRGRLGLVKPQHVGKEVLKHAKRE